MYRKAECARELPAATQPHLLHALWDKEPKGETEIPQGELRPVPWLGEEDLLGLLWNPAILVGFLCLLVQILY